MYQNSVYITFLNLYTDLSTDIVENILTCRNRKWCLKNYDMKGRHEAAQVIELVEYHMQQQSLPLDIIA